MHWKIYTTTTCNSTKSIRKRNSQTWSKEKIERLHNCANRWLASVISENLQRCSLWKMRVGPSEFICHQSFLWVCLDMWCGWHMAHRHIWSYIAPTCTAGWLARTTLPTTLDNDMQEVGNDLQHIVGHYCYQLHYGISYTACIRIWIWLKHFES